MSITSFTQLDVWKKAHRLVLSVYGMTRDFPTEERYGLCTQMRRAATSIPANIAEGFGRQRAGDKARFYNIGQGSGEELRYFLIMTRDLGYAKDLSEPEKLLDDVLRMLRKLVNATQRISRSRDS